MRLIKTSCFSRRSSPLMPRTHRSIRSLMRMRSVAVFMQVAASTAVLPCNFIEHVASTLEVTVLDVHESYHTALLGYRILGLLNILDSGCCGIQWMVRTFETMKE